jgi:hypothetical protein
MHDLKNVSTEGLRDRLLELSVGPASIYEARRLFCGCEEDCSWDSLDAIEGELILREMQVTR